MRCDCIYVSVLSLLIIYAIKTSAICHIRLFCRSVLKGCGNIQYIKFFSYLCIFQCKAFKYHRPGNRDVPQQSEPQDMQNSGVRREVIDCPSRLKKFTIQRAQIDKLDVAKTRSHFQQNT